MKPKIENKICAVTVTYGNRLNYLEQVLKRLLSFGQIGNVVVVNNGSSYNVEEALIRLEDNRILLVNFQENEGSAGGYYAGILKAHTETETDFIWLLDDDNLPDLTAADELLKAWKDLGADAAKLALYSQRVDRALDQEFIKGKDPFKALLVPNAILGVSYWEGLKNKFRGKNGNELPQSRNYIKVPYVPYGGFFAHRDMISLIGYPNRDFYLYVDDEDFTYRVTQTGGSIYMVPSARVKDIDITDGRVAYQAQKGSSPLLDLWSFRMYYRVRNSVYFHNKVSLSNPLLFALNKALFLFKLRRLSLNSGKQLEYKKFKQALEDGLKGRLGKADPVKF